MTETAQVYDIDFVREKLISLQRKKVYGRMLIVFEAGVMQDIEETFRSKPPSAKKNNKKHLTA